MTNSERYLKFCNNPKWTTRAVWRGKYGTDMFVNISICRWNEDTKCLHNLSFNNTMDYYKQMKKLAEQYANWCALKNPKLTDEEKEYLMFHFVGFIGEFFFVTLFEIKNQLIVRTKNMTYTFYDVCPLDAVSEDFGVDLTGRVTKSNSSESADCVFQVKFWHPFSKKKIDMGICMKLWGQATLEEMINHNDNDNLFICWLGDITNVSMWVNRYEKLSKHIVYIDKQVLKDNVDNDPIFWEKFAEKIEKL